MATSTLNWGIAGYSGTISAQQIYYGKKSVVTGNPDSGTGWTAFSGNDLGPTDISAAITGIIDNVRYRFLLRTINTPVGEPSQQCNFKEIEDIKYVCPTATFTPGTGVCDYDVTVPASVDDAGSEISVKQVVLIGVEAINGARIFKIVDIPTGNTTGTFTGVIGDVSWTIFTRYKNANGDILLECNSQTFTTSSADKIIYFRSGLRTASITNFKIGAANPPATTATNGTVSCGNCDVYDAQSAGATPQYFGITTVGISNGTSLFARLIRSGAEIASGIFTYSGANSILFGTAIALIDKDIVEVFAATDVSYVPQQIVVKKVAGPNGYNFQLFLNYTLPSDQTFDVTINSINNNGIVETITRPLIVAAGNVQSSLVFAATSFSPLQFTKTTIASVTINPLNPIVFIPQYKQ